MPYYINEDPGFTKLVCRGSLREPFRLVDIGVQGGVHRRWSAFGDHLSVLGFDALAEAVDALGADNVAPERLRYFNIGLGNEDGERLFEKVANPYGSAFLPVVATEADITRTEAGEIPPNWRRVPIRKLDTLYTEGLIGPTDFVKMDCEGFEIEILKGGQRFLRDSGVFGVESESHLFWHSQVPRSHFVELYERLIPLGFEVYDLGFYRTPRPALAKGFPVIGDSDAVYYRSIGQPNTFDFLFLGPNFKSSPALGTDTLIKMIATCELYGLQDVALSLLFQHQEQLGSRLDVEEAADCLVRDGGNSTMTYKVYTDGLRSRPPSPG